jgi:biotin synthase-like enzyme
MPVISHAGLVPCKNTPGDAKDTCNFSQFVTLINNVINFMIFRLALPIAGIMFTYAGFLMVTAGEEAAGARTKAKDIFINTIKGLCLALLCWVIVHSLLTFLGYSGSWIGL